MIDTSAPRANDGTSRVNKSRGTRRGLAAVAATLVAALAAGGYVAACAAAPLPELRATLLTPAESQFGADPAAAEAAVAAQALPTAIGWAHDDEVWANNTEPRPLASLSKLVTVLVCQEAQPLAPGADGPTYTWTTADVQGQAELLAVDGVAYPIPVGTEITLRNMLKLIFLPSSNDYAAAYAYSVFGDNETFLAAVEGWAARHDIQSLSFVEPTGMDEANQASADDLVRIARLVLANPTLTEFTGMKFAGIPGIGPIENTNPLLGEPGIIGLKTGRSSSAGFNFIAAQTTAVDGRELVKISVTLGRPSLAERAASGRTMLGLIEELPQTVEFVAGGEKLGSVVTWSGNAVPLVAAQAADGVLLPGEGATRKISLEQVEPGPAGDVVGSITVETPFGEETVPLVTGAEIAEPDLWWRIANPGALFDW